MILYLSKDPAVPKFVEVDSEKLIYLDFSKKYKMTAFHTLVDTYYMPGSLTYWAEGLSSLDSAFIHSDRCFVANARNVKCMINVFGMDYAYFEDEDKITDASKRCPISQPNVYLFEQIVQHNKLGPPK